MALTYAVPELAGRAALELERAAVAIPAARPLLAVPAAVPAADDDARKLAPKFARCVLYVLDTLIDQGFDPHLVEALRSDALQRHYYAQGRTRPGAIVTRAPTAGYSFHGYGLAVDIISRSQRWAAPMAFWTALGTAAEAAGLVWGGRWTSPRDYPHVQWGSGAAGVAIRISPSDHARQLLATAGVEAIWREVRAA